MLIQTAARRLHVLRRLTLVAMLAGCSGKQEQPVAQPAEVGVVTLTSGAVPTYAELTGRTNATTASDVRPQVDGLIMARLFTEGSLVRAGQPLYRIDPRTYRAAHDQAAANLENAQASYAAARAQVERYRALTETDAVSKQQIDNTVASAREALATIHQNSALLRAAKINLDYTLIRAPIGGRIGRSAVTQGALVTANQATALATIQKLDPIFVDVVQSADALLALRRSLAAGNVLPSGASVRLKLADGSTYPEIGRIEFAEVAVDQNAGTVTLRARFPNADGALLPGMFVRVEAPQGIIPNGVLAPQRGITRDAKGNGTALVVGTDNKVVQRVVTTSQAIGDQWLVTAGLKAGDRLIVDGTDKAQPGGTVRPVTMTTKAPADTATGKAG